MTKPSGRMIDVRRPITSRAAWLTWAAPLVLILLAVLIWRGSTESELGDQPRVDHTPRSSAGVEGARTPESGLAQIAERELPEQARSTLALIRAGGPYPYDEDDRTFENREGILPDQPRGYYREYTVQTPSSRDRGARRIVTGDDGDVYWTSDHYDSFRQIREGS